MAKGTKKYNIQNLKRRSSDEAREIGRKGGIQSGKSRREKKLMSQLYADFLAKKHDVDVKNGRRRKIEGYKMLEIVITKILERGDSASVGMMRELREATEGQKHIIDGGAEIRVIYVGDAEN